MVCTGEASSRSGKSEVGTLHAHALPNAIMHAPSPPHLEADPLVGELVARIQRVVAGCDENHAALGGRVVKGRVERGARGDAHDGEPRHVGRIEGADGAVDRLGGYRREREEAGRQGRGELRSWIGLETASTAPTRGCGPLPSPAFRPSTAHEIGSVHACTYPSTRRRPASPEASTKRWP